MLDSGCSATVADTSALYEIEKGLTPDGNQPLVIRARSGDGRLPVVSWEPISILGGKFRKRCKFQNGSYSMPLYDNAAELIRANLEQLIAGARPKRVEIGELDLNLFAEINQFRLEEEIFQLTEKKLVFIGKHIYESRIVEDGYSVDDVLDQIQSAMHPCAVLQLTERGTALQNPNKRADKYGNMVNDRIVFECSTCRPWIQLWSAIPIGDTNKPPK
jgi:hypothetical protein